MAKQLTIPGIAGSLRAGSFNRALLCAGFELAPDEMSLEIFDLDVVPLYKGDIEAEGNPEGVAALKCAIEAAVGVLMATPEYHHGVPGAMRNAVVWASRPPNRSPLGGKQVGLIGSYLAAFVVRRFVPAGT